MTERRKISFASLDAAISDAEQLLSSGYEKAGNWNFGQVCGHLENWLSYPMDGFPETDTPADATPDAESAEAGKAMLLNILANGFPVDVPTNPDTIPAEDCGSDEAALGRLRDVVQRFNAFEGEIADSPFFGEMDKEAVLGLQIRHFEHHFGFLVPK